MDDTEIRELLETWARQKIVCEQALATLANLEEAIKKEVGEREKSLYSENTVVYTKPGRKTWNWEQAVYDANVPEELFLAYSKMKTDFRRICMSEGIEKESVSFTQGDPKIVVELAMSDEERAAALPVDNPPSNKMFK